MQFTLFFSTALCLLSFSSAQAPVLGQDPAQPGETLGYASNHVCIFSSNLTTTKHFYGSILGMREIFSLDFEEIKVLYMGYPSPANATSAEMSAELTNKQGLVEFLHIPNRKQKFGEVGAMSHLGWVVPSLDKLQQRLVDAGWPILKRKGEEAKAGILQTYFAGGKNLSSEVLAALNKVPGGVVLVNDPEGNLLEVLERV